MGWGEGENCTKICLLCYTLVREWIRDLKIKRLGCGVMLIVQLIICTNHLIIFTIPSFMTSRS